MYHDERGSSQAQTLLWRLSIAATVCRHHRLRRRAQERGAGTERNLGSSAKRAVRLEQSDSTAHCRRHRCRFCAAESSWHGQASSSGTLVRANISHGASRQLTRPHQRTQPRVRAMAAAHCFVRGITSYPMHRSSGIYASYNKEWGALLAAVTGSRRRMRRLSVCLGRLPGRPSTLLPQSHFTRTCTHLCPS